MIPWDQLDKRLDLLGHDRQWLADQTPYTYDTIRNAMAPASTRRSERMLSILSRGIEDEEERQGGKETLPGVFDLFLTKESLDKADRASRIVQAPSLPDFCRDVIDAATDK